MTMTKLKLLGTLALMSICAAASAAVDEPTLWAYRYVLATATDFRELGVFIRQMNQEPSLRTPEYHDLLAELLSTHKSGDMREESARAALVRALVRDGNPRYYPVLIRIANEKTDSDARRVARTAMDRKKPPASGGYEVGMANVKELREEYARAALRAEPTDEQARRMQKIGRGDKIADVFEWAGTPHAASTRFRHRIASIDSYSDLMLYYRGIGRVQLRYNESRNVWIVLGIVIAPLAFEDYMPYRMDPAKYGQIDDNALALTQLVSNDRGAIRLMLDRTEQFDTASIELMDTAAERLLQEHALPEPPLHRDLYNWMCVLLTHEGGARYQNVLAQVASTTTDEKTRAFATEKIDLDKNPGAAPYVIGSISLEAQRAKYPSLYPGREFYLGRP